jgi:hypothetical protein
MNDAEFAEFKHNAIHALMRLNEACDLAFRLSSWPRWDYDLERRTLTFSKQGIPKVIASIQVVGTTSISGGTWLWGWANRSLPKKAVEMVRKVRQFGEVEGLSALTEAYSPDEEDLGWEMTAIAAEILHAKGAYRCPDDNGFVYLVYTDIIFTEINKPLKPPKDTISCSSHGKGFSTYVCEHLASRPKQRWFSAEPSEENRWPDAWCAACDQYFQKEGEWNRRNEKQSKVKLLCHRCYEKFRAQAPN